MSSTSPPSAVPPPSALPDLPLRLRLWLDPCSAPPARLQLPAAAPAPRCCSSSPLPFQLMLVITQDPDRASDPDPHMYPAPGSPLPPFPSDPTIFIMVQSDKQVVLV